MPNGQHLKVVLFDLDDTLYPEIDYVMSGFVAVASFLHQRYHVGIERMVSRMQQLLGEKGRGRNFNDVLQELELLTEERVQQLLFIYRSHYPTIALFPDALSVLESCRHQGLRVGIVTDGMASIQKMKIRALGLEGQVDLVVCTDEIGKEYWKPSPVPFTIALDLLGGQPQEAIYVGDNPTKDFLGPNRLGMGTVQVCRQGSHASVESSLRKEYLAQRTVHHLTHLLPANREVLHV